MINSDKEPAQFREINHSRRFWDILKQDKSALIGLFLFALLIFFIFFGYLLAPYQDDQQFIGMELLPPSWDNNGKISYFFGTDDLGRDILSRILHGFYYTVGSALLITVAVALCGGLIAIAASLNQRNHYSFLSHIFDTFLFMPVLLIAIMIATMLETGLFNAMIAVFLAMLPNFIRQIYQEMQRVLKREYVITLQLDGARKRDLFKEIAIPHFIMISAKSLSHIFVLAVLDISALSFISLGAKSPTPEWGAMIKDHIELIYIAPWSVILPGFFITLTIFIITFFGNNLSNVLKKYRHEQ